jgi:hypothetical protein
MRKRPFRHRRGNRSAHGALLREQPLRDVQGAGFVFLRIRDEAAMQGGGSARRAWHPLMARV